MRPLTVRTVLVATDLDRSSDAALDTAARFATAAGAALHVVHALSLSRLGNAGHRPDELASEEVRAALRRVSVPERRATIHVVPGSPASTIRLLSERVGADVVVVGPHRERQPLIGGHALGSTARAVVEHAFAPCLIATRPLPLPLARVLVPIDLSGTARGALLVALSWASALRNPLGEERTTALTVLHVDTGGEDAHAATATALDRELELLGRSAGSWSGVAIRGVIERSTDAADAIAAYTAQHGTDLVVFGTRGVGLDDDEAGLGSVSAELTKRLPHPVLLVPPAVWRAYAALP